MIGEAEMNIFVRYADIAGYPPMPYRVRAYDCRFFFILSGSGKIEIDGTEYRFAPDTLCYYPAGSAYTIIPEKQPRHPLRHAACSRGKLRKKAAA